MTKCDLVIDARCLAYELNRLIDFTATTRLKNDLKFLDRLCELLNDAASEVGSADRFFVANREGLIVRECGAVNKEMRR